MKVLMITQSFCPYIGGVEKHVRRVSEELIRKGHNVVVVTSKGSSELRGSEMIGNIPVHRFLKTRNLIRIWLWFIRHAILIRNATIIHCHDYYVFVYWYLPFRFLFFLKPVFITFHGWEGHFPPGRKEILLRKLSALLTKRNMCIGQYISKWYKVQCNYVSYGGTDSFQSTPSIANRSKNKALYIGRLSDDNAFLEYVKILEVLKTKYDIDFDLQVYGNGPLGRLASEYAHIHSLGVSLHRPVENPFEHSNDSIVAFSPGYLAILEAMIHKTIVCSIFNNELKRDYLLSFPASSRLPIGIPLTAASAEELADKLVSILDDPQKTELMGQEGFEIARQMTWKRVACAYLKMYSESREQTTEF